MQDKAQAKTYDVVIVGAGLAGQFVAHAIRYFHHRSKILLCEQSNDLSSGHTWSFHDGDIPIFLKKWVLDIVSARWDNYEVQFPLYERKFSSNYYSILSQDLGIKTKNLENVDLLFSVSVKRLDEQCVEFENGVCIQANLVIDCRGWKECQGPVAYQKFVGLDIQLKNEHALGGVRLMDARVKQVDGYRFMYCLPWSKNRLLVEDTYYSFNPQLSIDRIKSEIINYVREQNWEIDKIERVESGALPLALQRSSYSISAGSVPQLGAGSGFVHPVTGYSVPYLLSALNQVIKLNLDSRSWSDGLNKLQNKHKYRLWFYRLLNRMLFWSAEPEKRYLILQRFYRLPAPLISRYYGGRSSLFDCLRILIGKPPVKIRKAIPMVILD